MDLPELDDRLNSWKEIAAFLGRTVRTVQRWEKDDGLPLRRGGPGHRGLVVASKHEINGWWEGRRATLLREGRANGTSHGGHRENDGLANRVPRMTSGSPGRWRTVLIFTLIGTALFVGSAVPVTRRAATAAVTPARLGRLFATSTSEGRTATFIALEESPSGLAISPSGKLAYVALHDERAVAVVDLHQRDVVDRLDVIAQPGAIKLSPDGSRIVINGGSELGVYDLGRRTLRRFTDVGGKIHDLHVSRDSRSVWLTLAQRGLKVLDLETGRLDIVPTVGCPMFLTPAPRSSRVFVSYQCGGPGGRPGHDAIEIFDEARRTPVLARSGPPLVGSRLALSPDEQHLWADTADACAISDYDHAGCPPGSGPVLHALRADTLGPLLTIRVAGEGFGAMPIFSPDGTRLVLAGPRLSAIDRAVGTVLESFDRALGQAAFTADGNRLIALDVPNRRLVEFEISPPSDAWTLRDLATHWSGDGTADDVVGGTHALAAQGVHYEPGRYGQAFSFDGTTGEVNFGRRIDANLGEDPGTLAAWIKPRRVGPLPIASRTTSHGWMMSITNDGRLAFCLEEAQPDLSCASDGLVGQVRLQIDRWHHVAVIRSRSALSLFVDGRADGTRPFIDGFTPRMPEWNEAVLRLGAGPHESVPFHGLIDEVMFFRRALAPDDVARVMRATWLDAR